MIKLKDLIKEIGDASATPYKWEARNSMEDTLYNIKDAADKVFSKPSSTRVIDVQNYYYDFRSTETDVEYEIVIENWAGKVTNLSFLKGKPKPKKKYFIESSVSFDIIDNSSEEEMTITNLNEQYKVMATIVDCIKDFINQIEASESFQLNELHIFPKADVADTMSSIDSKRGRLYKAYIEKQIKTLPLKSSVTNIGDEGFKITLAH